MLFNQCLPPCSLWHARVKAKKNISLFHNQTRYILSFYSIYAHDVSTLQTDFDGMLNVS